MGPDPMLIKINEGWIRSIYVYLHVSDSARCWVFHRGAEHLKLAVKSVGVEDAQHKCRIRPPVLSIMDTDLFVSIKSGMGVKKRRKILPFYILCLWTFSNFSTWECSLSFPPIYFPEVFFVFDIVSNNTNNNILHFIAGFIQISQITLQLCINFLNTPMI